MHSAVTLTAWLVLSIAPAQGEALPQGAELVVPVSASGGSLRPVNPAPSASPSALTSVLPPTGMERPHKPAMFPEVAEVPAGQRLVIREPSQGRPIFVQPGGEFFFVMRMPPELSGGDTRFHLVHAIEPSLRVPLAPATPPAFDAKEFVSLVLKAPAATPEGVYDLEAAGDRGRHVAPRSVRVVGQFKRQFRMVHLSNMNVGDPTAPEFDARLPEEINLLAPEFILATGNFTEWSRAVQDAGSWQRVLSYLARFAAPVFVLCGLNDHEPSFTEMVVNSPVGTIDYGDYHGLLLIDHPRHPIEEDDGQLQWAAADLARNRDRTFNFVVLHSHEMGLLNAWRQRGNLGEFLRANRVRMMITGGATDWDRREFAAALSGIGDFHFIRTHQSSTCLRDGASGVSHYRVIDIDGDRISYEYPNDQATQRLQHSVPSGRLQVSYHGANDGTASQVKATVLNALNQSFGAARLWLRVAKTRSEPPSVAGGRLVRALDIGAYWACDIAVDLPAKGSVCVLAAANARDVPPAAPIDIVYQGPSGLSFRRAMTSFGLEYWVCDGQVALELRNRSREAVVCSPVIRLNGSPIHAAPQAGINGNVSLAGGGSVRIPLQLTLPRVSPGPQQLHVSFLGDPLNRLTVFPVTLAASETFNGTPDLAATVSPASR